MKKCNNCDEIFEDADLDTRKEPDYVTGRTFEWNVCPYCFNEDYSEHFDEYNEYHEYCYYHKISPSCASSLIQYYGGNYGI